jgi:hypothetical protein
MEIDGANDIVLLDVPVGVPKRDDVIDSDSDGVIDLDTLDVPDDVPE